MRLAAAMRVLSTLFVLASPWVLYLALSQERIDLAALALVGWVALRSIPILVATRREQLAAALVGWVALRSIPILVTARREQLAAALRLPAIALAFALLGWLSGSSWLLLILPSATQAAFGLEFLRSLAGTPLVEHFARLVKPALSAAELRHCRRWTAIWGGYLLVLAAIGLGLARFASLRVWTLYSGLVSYALVGALFAVEYVIRKLRFRDYGRNPVDWLLRRFFP